MPSRLPDGRYHGRIKTFNSRHGFGFIDCGAAYDKWRRDVFIHKQRVGDLGVGDEVTFEIKENKDGHPQARDVRMMNGSLPGPCPDGSRSRSRSRGRSRSRSRGRRFSRSRSRKGGKGKGKGKKGKGGDRDDRGKGKGKKGGGKDREQKGDWDKNWDEVIRGAAAGGKSGGPNDLIDSINSLFKGGGGPPPGPGQAFYNGTAGGGVPPPP